MAQNPDNGIWKLHHVDAASPPAPVWKMMQLRLQIVSSSVQYLVQHSYTVQHIFRINSTFIIFPNDVRSSKSAPDLACETYLNMTLV
jgi:hypothetical protein